MSRSRLVFALAALALSCRREAPRPLPLERVLPSHAGTLTVRLPSIVALDAMLVRLSSYKAADFAAQLQGFDSGPKLLDALPKSLGLDRSRLNELPQLGIDGAASFGGIVWRNGAFLLALPLTNERTFRENVSQGLEQRYGRAKREGALTTFGEGNVRAAFALIPGFALLAIGQEATTLLPGLPNLPEKDSWAASPTTTALRSKLPPGEVQFHLHTGDRVVAGSLRISAEGLALTTVESDLAESLRGLTLVPAPDLRAALAERGFLTLVSAVEPTALAPFAPRVATELQFPQPELWGAMLPLLAPGAAVTLGLVAKPHRAFTTVGAVDPRFLTVSGLTRTKAPPKELLAKLKTLGVLLTAGRGGEQALALSPHTGPLRVRATADWFALASPEAPPLPPPSDAAPATVALRAHFDFVRFGKALEALPAEGYGIGGESIRPFALRIVTAVSDLSQLDATIDIASQHLTFNLTLGKR